MEGEGVNDVSRGGKRDGSRAGPSRGIVASEDVDPARRRESESDRLESGIGQRREHARRKRPEGGGSVSLRWTGRNEGDEMDRSRVGVELKEAAIFARDDQGRRRMRGENRGGGKKLDEGDGRRADRSRRRNRERRGGLRDQNNGRSERHGRRRQPKLLLGDRPHEHPSLTEPKRTKRSRLIDRREQHLRPSRRSLHAQRQ
jgi:hypothetical protein